MKFNIHIEADAGDLPQVLRVLSLFTGTATVTTEPVGSPVAPAPKKKRSKKAAAPAKEPEPEPKKGEEKAPTLDDVRSALKQCVKAKKTAEATAVLQAHGAEALPELKPDTFAAVIADLEALVA